MSTPPIDDGLRSQWMPIVAEVEAAVGAVLDYSRKAAEPTPDPGGEEPSERTAARAKHEHELGLRRVLAEEKLGSLFCLKARQGYPAEFLWLEFSRRHPGLAAAIERLESAAKSAWLDVHGGTSGACRIDELEYAADDLRALLEPEDGRSSRRYFGGRVIVDVAEKRIMVAGRDYIIDRQATFAIFRYLVQAEGKVVSGKKLIEFAGSGPRPDALLRRNGGVFAEEYIRSKGGRGGGFWFQIPPDVATSRKWGSRSK